ncbi:hypothetical protein [Phormidesmis priestleyi]
MKNYTLGFITLIAVLTGLNLTSCKPSAVSSAASPDQKLSSLPDQKPAGAHKDVITIGDNNEVPVHWSFGNYKTFSSDDELFQIADLVVIGRPITNLDETSFKSVTQSESKSRKHQDSESIVTRDSSGNVVDTFSIIGFRAQKFLKGDSKEKQLRVLQPSVYIQEPNKAPYVWLPEGSSPLQKKSRYVLFLKQVDTAVYPNLAGVYSIISVNQGKFNLDKTDAQESEVERSDEQYRQLKEKVRKRFESDFNSTPDL